MNHATRTIGDSTSVKERYGTNSAFCRPEKLIEVKALNLTGVQGDGGALYLQVHNISPGTVVAPADGVAPLFSFPVFSQTGGELGGGVDMMGIYCCWSSTAATKTLVVANSGSIAIIVKA